jgi:hypothetical protein
MLLSVIRRSKKFRVRGFYLTLKLFDRLPPISLERKGEEREKLSSPFEKRLGAVSMKVEKNNRPVFTEQAYKIIRLSASLPGNDGVLIWTIVLVTLRIRKIRVTL